MGDPFLFHFHKTLWLSIVRFHQWTVVIEGQETARQTTKKVPVPLKLCSRPAPLKLLNTPIILKLWDTPAVPLRLWDKPAPHKVGQACSTQIVGHICSAHIVRQAYSTQNVGHSCSNQVVGQAFSTQIRGHVCSTQIVGHRHKPVQLKLEDMPDLLKICRTC